MEKITVGADYETFSECDIKKSGAYAYARHPSTELLILRAIVDDAEGNELDRVEWDYGQPMPKAWARLIKKGYMFRAFNAAFEWQITTHVMAAKMGWPDIPLEQWYCTQGTALRHALPTSLDKCASAFNTRHKKLASGTRLITKFSKPRKPTKGNDATRNYPEDFPEDFEEFGVYCLGDVEAERELYWGLPCREYPPFERDVWLQLQRQNDRGVLVDVSSVEAILRMNNFNRKRRLTQLRKITDNVVQTDGQRDAVLTWCADEGYPLEGYTKDDIKLALKDPKLPEPVARVLEIRQELGQTSLAKYPRFVESVCPDSTLKGSIIYHRATTGRNGAGGVQPHNFPRDYVTTHEPLIETCLNWVREDRYEDIELVFGSLVDVAKGMLRPMFISRPGKMFYSADFSSIENRVTVWVAQDDVGIDIFANGVDQYRAFVAKQFGIAPEAVTPEMRTDGKATILGAMFGAGANTIWKTNVQKGIPMTLKQAKRNVAEFREQYAVTAATWYELDEVCVEACRMPKGKALVYKGLKFFCREGFFFIRLHSGRLLAYHDPRVEQVKTPWGAIKWAVTHNGLNAKGFWGRQTLTPSRIIENIVQAEARDLLMYSKMQVEDEGYDLILDVHDEILAEQDPDYASVEDFEKIMSRIPDWAKKENGAYVDFPLKAEGGKFTRYRK